MSLRIFCLRIFQHCPLLAQFSVENHTQAFEEFLEYKTRIPVRGAIMLNSAMDSAVLVKGWKKGASWGFPGGKINKDEDDLDCAIREVYEETGFDVREAGLVPADGKVKYIELPIRNHQVRLYVFRDVPLDTKFEPKTRKEISKIQWYRLSELPTFRKKAGQINSDSAPGSNANKFYMVAPFMVPLKKWVGSQKKLERKGVEANQYLYPYMPIEELPTEEEGWTQAETDVPPARGPAITTLDGASQELQRLLKMQPPTQGLQPQPPQQDKGSALLSMLQAKTSGPPASSQQASGIPQTPLEQTFVQINQPGNPHRPTNQQVGHLAANQPPPNFPIPPNFITQHSGGVYHNVPAAHQHYSPSPMEFAQQHYGNKPASLVHPQPLPPQVQRAMFDRSAFQEGSQTLRSHVYPNAPRNNENAPWASQNAEVQGRPVQASQQPQGAHSQTRSTQLNGQSLALLNAFKRGDVAPAASNPERPPPVIRPTVEVEYRDLDAPPPYNAAGITGQPPLGNMSKQRSPTELAGTAINPGGDQHKSTLLGMFKRGSDAAANTPSAAAMPSQASSLSSGRDGGQLGNSLIQQLQGQGRKNGAQVPNATQPTYTAPLDAGFERLAMQPQQPQPIKPMAAAQATHQPPMRILQRGQQEPMLPQNMQAAPPAKAAAFGSQAQQPAASSFAAMPSNQRQEAPSAQKRQLLSLFGKQPSPAAALAMTLQTGQNELVAREPSERSPAGPPEAMNPSHAGVTSPQRGQETPMSPAEQSFLFDYLQSVTNTSR